MISGFISLIVWLLVIGVLVALVIYVADTLLPQPIGRIVRVVAIVIAALALVLLLLQMLGVGGVSVPQLTVN